MTIFALSSGAPPAAIGVIRISGAGAGDVLAAIVGRLPAPRRATYAAFHDPADGELLDRGLALWFPGPRTATGEDLAELHIHGGRAVAAAMLAALGRMAGLRPALPGEFTRRAFANGVIDLAEAEGLADLLAAETDLQRRAALASAGGALSRRVEAWRGDVLNIAAATEAILDFADEDDVAADEMPIRLAVGRLSGEIAALLATPPSERLRDGIRVVLAGPPNVGKSTLLNAIAGREAAIVSPVAGTTRDVIEVPVAIGGIPFLFSDTAGLRDSDDPVEQAGVARAGSALADADIILWLADPSLCPDVSRAILVHPRSDIVPVSAPVDAVVSALSGAGVAALIDRILHRAGRLLPRTDEVTVNRRQRDALQHCTTALSTAAQQSDLLIVAEHLREARQALDEVVGRSGVEDMLDALFGRFCIGK